MYGMVDKRVNDIADNKEESRVNRSAGVFVYIEWTKWEFIWQNSLVNVVWNEKIF